VIIPSLQGASQKRKRGSDRPKGLLEFLFVRGSGAAASRPRRHRARGRGRGRGGSRTIRRAPTCVGYIAHPCLISAYTPPIKLNDLPQLDAFHWHTRS
jgi:hypothetical protein